MAVQRADESPRKGVDSDWLAFSSEEDRRISEIRSRRNGVEGCCAAISAVFPRRCRALSGPAAMLAALSLGFTGSFFGTTAAGDGPTWQPRPLALPATTEDYRWSPPEKVEPVSAPVTQVILPSPTVEVEPDPEPTPAEIRQSIIAEKRAEKQERMAFQRMTRPSQPLPPSDQINMGSRKSQLAQEAVEQLRIANWASKRGAIASAQAAATKTLRTIATLRDSQIGDNLHTQQLNACFTAIRESADFAGRYGPVDTHAIERLIEVHQTPALKNVATGQLTSPRAIEAYLDFAKTSLVNATQGGPLAAEAALILADLETLLTAGAFETPADHSSLHSSELALMYRRAAVEITPDNADASADLGRTLLKRSIPAAAKHYLLGSVRTEPTRQRVESLMEAAALSGDFVLVDQCEKQLTSSPLPSELPITMMSPQDFARTNRSMTNQSMANIVSASPHAPISPPSMAAPAPQYRVSSRVNSNSMNHSINNGQAYRPGSASAGQIVDPTLPAPRLASPPTNRLHW